ncbi:MAG: methyl-accepting chemotaxis protein [Salinarimonas sp.]
MLSKFTIGVKIGAIIAIMTTAAVTISVVSYLGLVALAASADRINLGAEEVRLSAMMNQNALEMSRAEYRIVADPSSFAAARDTALTSRSVFSDRLERLRATATGQQLSLIAAVESRAQDYFDGLNTFLAEGERYQNSNISEAQRRLIAAVNDNRNATRALRESLSELATYTEAHGADIAREAQELATSKTLLLALIAVIGTFAGGLFGFIVAKSGITVPLRRIVDCLQQLSGGKLDIAIPDTQRKDEVGDVAQTALVLQQGLVRAKQLEDEAEAAEARAEERRKQEMLRMADDFESAVSEIITQVGAAAEQLNGNAVAMSTISEETSNQVLTVSAAAEEASTNVGAVAAASEELSATVTEVARDIHGTSSLAANANEEAVQTASAVDAVAQVVERVAGMTELISDIADKTNLLALNATIEAARAGEAGRGFAVVATEVKQLAEQTSKATEQINLQIADMKSSADLSKAAVDRIVVMIKDITERAANVAAAAEQQQSATGEIARNVSEAATGTSSVSEAISGVREAAAEAGKMSSEVRDASQLLNGQAGELKNAVAGFLNRVRAA